MNFRNKGILYLIIIFLLTHIFISCHDSHNDSNFDVDFTPQALSDNWDISTPELQGMSSEKLQQAYNTARVNRYFRSLLVIRNSNLVAEAYFHEVKNSEEYDIFSATKSFLSACIGIAIREEFITGLDQKMMDFFPEYDPATLGPVKYNITIRHLLQMRTGYKRVNLDLWYSIPDLVDYVINLPLVFDLDTSWDYTPGSSHLLSAILTRASGMSTEDFARLYLFTPLGLDLTLWRTDMQGITNGSHGLYMKPRDMARFGLLYLNGGVYNGIQVVPSAWVSQSTVSYSDTGWYLGAMKNSGYAYHWWTGTISGYSAYFAWGYGGQYIVVISDLDLVIVVTSIPRYDLFGDLDSIIHNFIAANILPAVL